jgi:hypothetical protein
MAIRILNNTSRKLNGFFLEEAPCGSTGFFTPVLSLKREMRNCGKQGQGSILRICDVANRIVRSGLES